LLPINNNRFTGYGLVLGWCGMLVRRVGEGGGVGMGGMVGMGGGVGMGGPKSC